MVIEDFFGLNRIRLIGIESCNCLKYRNFFFEFLNRFFKCLFLLKIIGVKRGCFFIFWFRSLYCGLILKRVIFLCLIVVCLFMVWIGWFRLWLWFIVLFCFLRYFLYVFMYFVNCFIIFFVFFYVGLFLIIGFSRILKILKLKFSINLF